MKKDPTIIGGDKEHAVFSASGSERWMNCPGSIALSKKAPEEPESPFALEGTKAHECLEYLLKSRHVLECATPKAYEKYPKEMVNVGFSSVQEILKIYYNSHEESELYCEQKVDSSFFTTKDQFGTLDAAIVEEFGTLWIIDYKYGKGYAVDPEGPDGTGNPQLVYYALGIAAKHNFNFIDVKLVIIQPRATQHPSGQTTRVHTLTITELMEWIPRFKRATQRALKETETYVKGPWCKFCKAAIICPEIKEKGLKTAGIVISKSGSLQSIPAPEMINTPDLGRMLGAADRLELWIEKIRAHAFHVLTRGGSIDGYKLVEKRATRKWKDETEAEKELFTMFGSDAFTTKIISPSDAEKKIGKKKNLKTWLDKLIVKESSGLTMVKDEDKRHAVDSAESVFGVIDV